MKWEKITVSIVMVYCLIYGQNIKVENVFVPQDSIRSGGKADWAGICTYDLIDTGQRDTFKVWAEMSTDSGKYWYGHIDFLWFGGDYGAVAKGTHKKITWRYFGLSAGSPCLIKVFASDTIGRCVNDVNKPWILWGVLQHLGSNYGDTIFKYFWQATLLRNPKEIPFDYKTVVTYGPDTITTKTNTITVLAEDTVIVSTDTFSLRVNSQELRYDTTMRCLYITAVDSCGNNSSAESWCERGTKYQIKFP